MSTEKPPFQPIRKIVDRETGVAIHPEGTRGYINEMAKQATEEWQGIQKLVPDLPSIDMSPRELVDMIMKQHPKLEARVSTEDDKYPGEVRLRETKQIAKNNNKEKKFLFTSHNSVYLATSRLSLLNS